MRVRSFSIAAVVGLTGLVAGSRPADACDPAVLHVPALQANNPPLMLTTARSGAWWWIVSSTAVERLELRDADGSGVNTTFLRAGPEWMGVRVPDNSESGDVFTILDPAVGDRQLEVAGEAEVTSQPSLGEPELRHEPFVQIPGCGGFQERVERDRWVLWFDVDVSGDNPADLAIDVWALPEGVSVPADDAPRGVEGLPFVGSDDVDGRRFALFAEEEGRYEVFARVRDLRSAATSEVKSAVVDVEAPRSAGCAWSGFGCSGGGVPWPVVLVVLIRIQNGSRKRRER